MRRIVLDTHPELEYEMPYTELDLDFEEYGLRVTTRDGDGRFQYDVYDEDRLEKALQKSRGPFPSERP